MPRRREGDARSGGECGQPDDRGKSDGAADGGVSASGGGIRAKVPDEDEVGRGQTRCRWPFPTDRGSDAETAGAGETAGVIDQAGGEFAGGADAEEVSRGENRAVALRGAISDGLRFACSRLGWLPSRSRISILLFCSEVVARSGTFLS